jgi:hypothetical protein
VQSSRDLGWPRPRETRGRGASFRPLVEGEGRKPLQSLKTDEGARNWGLLCEVVDAGIGVLIGRTRDGGAVSMTVLDGDERFRSYGSTDEEVDAMFGALRNFIRS